MMTELADHEGYRLLTEEYDKCLLDYVILCADGTYRGEESHQEAVTAAFGLLNGRERISNHRTRGGFRVFVKPEKMAAIPIPVEELFFIPEDMRRYKTRRDAYKPGACWDWRTDTGRFCYGYAFLHPPYGVPYWIGDFERLNRALFPDRKTLEVFCWNDAWSNYFEDGGDWWGTGCWSVYDRRRKTFVVIGASLSD